MKAHLQFGALADPTRRAIFETLTTGPRSVGDLAEGLPVTRPAVSQHLKVLADVGLVTVQQDGTRRIYSIEVSGLESMARWLSSFWSDVIDHYEAAARKERKEMPNTSGGLPPVIKTRRVPLGVEDAFALFTERLDTWWPLEGFSIGVETEGQPPKSVRFEGRVGGRVVEIDAGGVERAWADVIAWQPPHRFVLAWHPAVDPTASSILEVRFSAVDEGTELYLEHRGWEEFGAEGDDLRESYERGWDVVLRPFEESTAQASVAP